MLLVQDDAAKAEQFITNTINNMSFSTNVEDAAAKSDLVVEAIVEKLDIKQDLFSKIDKVNSITKLSIFLINIKGMNFLGITPTHHLRIQHILSPNC